MAHEDMVRAGRDLAGVADQWFGADPLRHTWLTDCANVLKAEGASSTKATVSSTESEVTSARILRLTRQIDSMKSMVKQYAMPTEVKEGIEQQIGQIEHRRNLERTRREIRMAVENNPSYVGDILAVIGFYCAPIKSAGRTPAECFIVCDINPGTDIVGLCSALTSDGVWYEITSYGDCEGTIRVQVG